MTGIGNFLFHGCGGLADNDGFIIVQDVLFCYVGEESEIVVPDSVTSVWDFAFLGCSGLKSVTIPNSVSCIGYEAFLNCSGLKVFSVDSGNVNYKFDNGLLLSKDGRTLIAGVNGDVTIPSCVTGIGLSAFYGCSGLTSVTMQGDCPTVGEYVFSGVPSSCVAYLPGGNTTYEVTDGKWQGMTVEYYGAETSDRDKVQLWEGGPYWAMTNIGAEKPEDYGYYFWWGDTVGYKRAGEVWAASDGSSPTFSFNETNTKTFNKSPCTLQSENWVVQESTHILAPEHDAAQVQWGGGWRMPTRQELYDLCHNKCDWTWTALNGVNGYIVRGRGAYASNSIFLPCAGFGNGVSLSNSGSCGYYWSSVPYSSYDSSYYYMYINASWPLSWSLGFDSCHHGFSNSYSTSCDYRCYGLPVRPVQGFTNTPITYTIRFNANGGTGTMADLPMTYGTAKNLTANGFTRADYTFAGWATNENGSVAYANGASVNNLSATQGAVVNLYAKWMVNENTIVFKTEDEYTAAGDGAFTLDLAEVVDSASAPKFTVKGLPAGLKYDAKTMAISGVATKPGVYTVIVSATNATVKKAVETTFTLTVPNLTDAEIPVADQYGPFIPGVAYTNTVGAAADCAVTGLPSGMKWTAKDILFSKTKAVAIPANSFYGAATKPGSYTVYFTKTLKEKETNAAGKTVSVKHTATATFTVGPFPVVAVEIGGTGTGKVTGAGAFAANKKVTLKATADTKDAAATARTPATVKSAFVGWYDGETLLSRDAGYSLVVPEEDITLTAKFVTAAEDAAGIAAAVNGGAFEVDGEGAVVMHQTNVWAGVYLEWPVEVSALSLPTVKVAGLPAGLKFTAKDIVDSKTKQVTVPANTIYGVPTAASKVNAKTGEVTPSAVKVTVTTAGKSTQTYQINVTVDALPAWAVGTFDGGGGGHAGRVTLPGGGSIETALSGQATITVSAAGKISGKLLSNGLTWALSAASFTDVERPLSDVDDPAFLATVIGKSGKLAITNELAITAEALGADGVRGVGVLTGDVSVAVYQNLWKTEPWKTTGKSIANKMFIYEVEDAYGNPGLLTLKLAATGAVTAKGVFTTGVNDRTGKEITYTASGTATLLPMTEPNEEGEFSGVVWVCFPPKTGAFAGYVDCVEVPAEERQNLSVTSQRTNQAGRDVE